MDISNVTVSGDLTVNYMGFTKQGISRRENIIFTRLRENNVLKQGGGEYWH